MAEPISWDEIDAHLRLAGDDSERELIENVYIPAARQWVEDYTGHILVQRQVEDSFPMFLGHLELAKRPIVSVDEIAYVGTDGVAGTYADFITTEGRYPMRVYPALKGWFPQAGRQGVTVRYTAGYAEGEVPHALKQAMLLLVGHFYAQREAVSDRAANEVPFAVMALAAAYRSPMV